MDSNTPAVESKAVGPLVGLVVILVLIVLGGVYFWMNRTTPNPANTPSASTTPESVRQQNDSDDINSIEADLRVYSESDIDNSSNDNL